MRQRKRRLMAGTPRHGRSSRARGPITFPPPCDTWGTVTHAWGPFVPLPIRAHVRKRDRGMERKWGRIARATRLLTIREE